jgi:hypothetical protein
MPQQETIGNVTGNEAWKSSGVQDKEQAVGAMKQAGANRDARVWRRRVLRARSNRFGYQIAMKVFLRAMN